MYILYLISSNNFKANAFIPLPLSNLVYSIVLAAASGSKATITLLNFLSPSICSDVNEVPNIAIPVSPIDSTTEALIQSSTTTAIKQCPLIS